MNLDTLTQATVDLVSAVLDSADMEVIGRSHWYPRAQSALETAAAGAENAGQAISIMCRKLQVDALGKDAAALVVEIAETLDANWGDWVQKVARESPYLIALTRVARTARNVKKETSK